MISGMITVRTNSSRLPNKCLLPFGEGNVIEHIIRRAKHYGLDPIVCTSTDPADNVLEKIAKQEGVRYFRGSLNNKLKRWVDCCAKFKVAKFHSIDADDPFFDGDLMKKSYALLETGYDMVSPTASSHAGAATVGFSLTANILRKAMAFVKYEEEDTEVMWSYIERVPGLRKIEMPEQENNPIVARMTLDYEEDYWMLQTVRRLVGNLASRQAVDDLFRKNPDLKEINWFLNMEWKNRQLNKELEATTRSGS